MKRNNKILSLALAAFLLTGCNLFNKGAVKWQDFSFDVSDQLDDVEKEVFLYKVSDNLYNFKEVSMQYDMYTWEVAEEVTASYKVILTAYENDCIVQTSKGSASTTQNGVTTSEKIDIEETTLQAAYMDGTETKYCSLSYEVDNGKVEMKKEYITQPIYTVVFDAVYLVSAPVYRVKDGYRMVVSTVNESHSDVDYGAVKREQITITKMQYVYTISKDYKLTKVTLVGEESINRDDSGKWYDKMKTTAKYAMTCEVKYGTRATNNKASDVYDQFNQAFFVGDPVIDVMGCLGDVDVSSFYPKTSVKQIYGDRLHVSLFVEMNFDSTCNGFRLPLSFVYYEDYKHEEDATHVDIMLGELLSKFTVSQVSVVDQPPRNIYTAKEGVESVTMMIEFEASLHDGAIIDVFNPSVTFVE